MRNAPRNITREDRKEYEYKLRANLHFDEDYIRPLSRRLNLQINSRARYRINQDLLKGPQFRAG